MKGSALALALAAFAASACGENFPPESCFGSGDHEVFVDATKSVPICFEDAEGDRLEISAEAADPGVVGVSVQGGTRALVITGVSVGETEIYVTATDEVGGMGEAVLRARVPNRAPTSVPLPDFTLTDLEPMAEVDLTIFFSDPDRDELLYEVQANDESIVEVAVEGSTLTITGKGTGTTMIRIRASDPHGGSVLESTTASLRVSILLLRDDFEGDSLLWRRSSSAVTELLAGRLGIGGDSTSWLPNVTRDVLPATNWRIRANVENTEAGWGTIIVTLGDSEWARHVLISFGGDANRLVTGAPYSNLVVMLHDHDSWALTPAWHADISSMAGAGEPMDVEARMSDQWLSVHVNGHQVFRISTRLYHPVYVFPNDPIAKVSLAGLKPVGESTSVDRKVYFDWVEAWGIVDPETKTQNLNTKLIPNSRIRMTSR